jgi:hypothetical protein
MAIGRSDGNQPVEEYQAKAAWRCGSRNLPSAAGGGGRRSCAKQNIYLTAKAYLAGG